jgi:hypothetical protein
MGNRFGNYQTAEAAEQALVETGFTKTPSGRFTKPSTDGFGFPMTALVEITESFVAGLYTTSGNDEPYYQHHFLS